MSPRSSMVACMLAAFVVQHWASHRGAHIREDGPSDWYRRFGKELLGSRGFRQIPFGGRQWFAILLLVLNTCAGMGPRQRCAQALR